MIFANFALRNPVIPIQVQRLKSLKYNTLYFQCQISVNTLEMSKLSTSTLVHFKRLTRSLLAIYIVCIEKSIQSGSQDG